MGFLGVKGWRKIPRFDEDGNIVNLQRNQKATNELWEKDPEAKAQRKVIYHFNEHTNGYVYKVMWHKKNMIVTNKFKYRLLLSRKNKRTIPQILRNDGEFLTAD
jgi:hypothetical protein